MHRSRTWPLRWILAPALLCGGGALAAGEREQGLDHYFNREFKLAVATFDRHLASEPDSPEALLLLAKALLYQELDRLGYVGTRAFRGDRLYRSAAKPKPDPETGQRITDMLEQGRLACERILAEAPDDKLGLHWLAQFHIMRASYQYFIAKAYFKALGSGKQSRALSYRLGELYPEFADGLLVGGFHDYILGSLPWALRAMVAMSGHRGNKKRGIEMVERAASEGVDNRHEARILLAVIYRGERPPELAAEAFAELAAEFPRAYMFPLEAADLYESARQREKSLELFREVSRKQQSGQDRFDRMPERMAAALQRRIEALERAIARQGRK